MLAFYGLWEEAGRIDWTDGKEAWALEPGQNVRRISRVLCCMHSAGFTAEPAALLAFLEREFGKDPRRANALSWWRHQVSG